MDEKGIEKVDVPKAFRGPGEEAVSKVKGNQKLHKINRLSRPIRGIFLCKTTKLTRVFGTFDTASESQPPGLWYFLQESTSGNVTEQEYRSAPADLILNGRR